MRLRVEDGRSPDLKLQVYRVLGQRKRDHIPGKDRRRGRTDQGRRRGKHCRPQRSYSFQKRSKMHIKCRNSSAERRDDHPSRATRPLACTGHVLHWSSLGTPKGAGRTKELKTTKTTKLVPPSLPSRPLFPRRKKRTLT